MEAKWICAKENPPGPGRYLMILNRTSEIKQYEYLFGKILESGEIIKLKGNFGYGTSFERKNIMHYIPIPPKP